MLPSQETQQLRVQDVPKPRHFDDRLRPWMTRKHLREGEADDLRNALRVISVDEVLQQAPSNPRFRDMDPRFMEYYVRRIWADLNADPTAIPEEFECVQHIGGWCICYAPPSGRDDVLKIRTLCDKVVEPVEYRYRKPTCMQCLDIIRTATQES